MALGVEVALGAGAGLGEGALGHHKGALGEVGPQEVVPSVTQGKVGGRGKVGARRLRCPPNPRDHQRAAVTVGRPEVVRQEVVRQEVAGPQAQEVTAASSADRAGG